MATVVHPAVTQRSQLPVDAPYVQHQLQAEAVAVYEADLMAQLSAHPGLRRLLGEVLAGSDIACKSRL
jgi:hypothetical protein